MFGINDRINMIDLGDLAPSYCPKIRDIRE